MVFRWPYITFCLFVLYLNSIHKQYDNNPYGLKLIAYSWKTNEKLNGLGNFNAMFPALLHCGLTLYSTGDEQSVQKKVNLLMWFGLIYDGKRIDKCLVIWWPPLNFSWYFLMWLNYIYPLFLLWEKIWWQ